MRGRNTHTDRTPGRTPRRGSALLVTVGTLALIAVIAAFYVTLGQSDTRVAGVVEHKSEIASVENQIAEYIARVVAADRLAVTVETITDDEDEVGSGFDYQGGLIQPDGADRQRFVREATDYPYTDYSSKSVFSAEPGIEFKPSDYANTPLTFGDSQVLLSAAVDRFRFNPAGDSGVMLDLPGDTIDFNQDTNALRDY
ncbi:MAG: hypothetical protein K8E66_02175, partial [Phycisphaerales bacterium]|nr:hypothetical protein [Phycisphaerales bacterium]